MNGADHCGQCVMCDCPVYERAHEPWTEREAQLDGERNRLEHLYFVHNIGEAP